ncbi:MAG: SAM-dependent methyltransferase, partial [Pseudomonadota bacterium]
MTPLAERFRRRIAATGPITLADFMSECLLDPEHGYYGTRDPLGRGGDFTTAPEISQMFGEMVGLWLAQTWMDQGAPDPFCLAELGPGRGTLMADILRATARVPGFQGAAKLHLVEASPALRAAQAERLGAYQPVWLDQAADLPLAPLFLVANEFFDALPIRQFQRHANGWCERQVGLEGDELCFGLSAPAPIAGLDHRLNDTEIGEIVETCAPAQPIIESVAARIEAHGGTALVVDYGKWGARGDTFQAVRNHAYDDPLAQPGAADLTAHVDFEALARAAARWCAVTPIVTQGVFLERLGITARAQQLAKRLSGRELETHIAAHRRLTHPDEMGYLFKV